MFLIKNCLGCVSFVTSNCFRELKDGDIVNVDVTVYYKGVHGKPFLTIDLFGNVFTSCRFDI